MAICWFLIEGRVIAPFRCIPPGQYSAKGLPENLQLKLSWKLSVMAGEVSATFHDLDWNLEFVFLAFYTCFYGIIRASQVTLVIRNLSANAGDGRDADLIPGLGRSLEKVMATQSRILAWRIPWTEEPHGLQSMGSQRGHTTKET